MIGRHAEADWLTDGLASGGVRQIVGPGGMGKSTLVRTAVEGRSTAWLTLEPVAPGAILPTLAGELDVPGNLEALAAAVTRQEVVVLDGAEAHEDEILHLVDDWRGRGVPTPVVVTTRRRLANWPTLELGPLTHDEAVALFVKRAEAVSSKASGEDDDAIDELVRRLDGWPLALELAASRVRLFAPAEMLEQDMLPMLTDRRRSGRHGSLQRTLEASWQQLTDAEREALSRIALVRGAFTRQGFRDVTLASVAELEGLLDASLVTWESVEEGRRYRLLEVVREFALSHLPSDDSAHQRYGELVVSRADEARASLDSPRCRAATDTLRRLSTDLESLLEAPSVDIAGRAALGLVALAIGHGPIERGLTMLEAIADRDLPPELHLECVQRKAEILNHLTRFDEALEALHGLEISAEVLALRAWASRATDLQAAVELNLEAVKLADATGRPKLRAATRLAAGVVLRRAGRNDASVAIYRVGLSIARQMEAPRLEAALLANHALVYSDKYGADEAMRAELTRAGDLVRGLGLKRVLAQVLVLSSQCHVDLKHPGLWEVLSEAQSVAESVGESLRLQTLRLLEANARLEAGELEPAAAILDILHPRGAPNEAMHAAARGWLAFARGETELAVREFERSKDRYTTVLVEREVIMLQCAIAAVDRRHPSPLMDGRWDPGSPVHTAWCIATAIADDQPIPATLIEKSAGSIDCRLLLQLGSCVPEVQVSRDGSWFHTPQLGRVDLGRRRVLKRVLAALASEETIALDAILTTAWPGERMTGNSGKARVHVAISELRKLGLRDAIQTAGETSTYRLEASRVD